MAFSPQQAKKLVRARLSLRLPMYSLLLLDYSMPQEDGVALAKNILRETLLDDESAPIPYVCICTAVVDKRSLTPEERVFIRELVQKPLMKNQLQRLLANVQAAQERA